MTQSPHAALQARTLPNVPRAVLGSCLIVAVLTALASAQTSVSPPSDSLRHPGWNYGGQVCGGFTVIQVTSPNFLTANRNISNAAGMFRLARVLSHEHGRGLLRGTFEMDFNLIPFEIFWVLGSHYGGI